MNLTVVGTGYVGLVTGVCLADIGHQVTCVDIDEKKIAQLSNGEVPIFEPDLDSLLEKNLAAGRISFTTDLQTGIQDARVIFLALPTPEGADGSADLQYVLAVAKQLGSLLQPNEYKVIVNKSTVPVGTAAQVTQIINAQNPLLAESFDVVSNPEFLREGVAVKDFLNPDRIVIGTDSEKAKQIMLQVYEPFARQDSPILIMDALSSELTKYAANSFLATKISFMNEIAQVCEKLGADVDKVRMGIGSDGRIGKRFLFSGIGYGGSCFPKDVKALEKSAELAGYNFKILQAVEQVNATQRLYMIEKINEYFNHNLHNKKIAVWGLSFKPKTDDVREAPAFYLINELLRLGAVVSAYDPIAMDNAQKVYGNTIHFATSQYEALQNADALLICTEWNDFKSPNFSKMSELLNEKVIFDGRNLFATDEMQKLGYYYASIGRNLITPAITTATTQTSSS